MLLVPQTDAAASNVLSLSFGFAVLSFRSLSYAIYVVVLVLFCFVCHISGGARHLFFIIYFVIFCHFFFLRPFRFSFCEHIYIAIVAFVCIYRTRYDGMPMHSLLCRLHYIVVSLCRGFVTTELVFL